MARIRWWSCLFSSHLHSDSLLPLLRVHQWEREGHRLTVVGVCVPGKCSEMKWRTTVNNIHILTSMLLNVNRDRLQSLYHCLTHCLGGSLFGNEHQWCKRVPVFFSTHLVTKSTQKNGKRQWWKLCWQVWGKEKNRRGWSLATEFDLHAASLFLATSPRATSQVLDNRLLTAQCERLLLLTLLIDLSPLFKISYDITQCKEENEGNLIPSH